jgi:hypothetical protein
MVVSFALDLNMRWNGEKKAMRDRVNRAVQADISHCYHRIAKLWHPYSKIKVNQSA